MLPETIIRQILEGVALARAAGVECYPPSYVVIDGVWHAVQVTAVQPPEVQSNDP